MVERLYSKKETATLLGVSVSFLEHKVAAREVPHRRVAGHREVKFSAEDIAAIIADSAIPVEASAQPSRARRAS